MKICHLTSSHPRYDTRIFLKECSSLAAVKDFDVHLIVADGKGDERQNNVQIIDVGKENSRKKQLVKAPKRIYKKAMQLNANVYHFHDPEFIFMANKLRKKGKKVIYDSHEDVPRVWLTRNWLNENLRKIVAFTYELIENYSARRFTAIVTVTPHIEKRFLKINSNTFQVANFPIIKEKSVDKSKVLEKKQKNTLCYIGAIDKIRGILEIMDVLEKLPGYTLHLAGNFENEALRQEVENHKAYKQVHYHGYVGRKKIIEILNESTIGLLILHDTPNHRTSYPIKLFEYMMMGLPVVASNFLVWRNIIEKYNVGICINPQKSEEITNAIIKLSSTPKLMGKMADNAQKAVSETFNWESQADKLINLYFSLMK